MAQVALHSTTNKPTNEHLGWKTLGAFVVTFIITWLAYAVWGVAICFIGRQFDIPQSISSSISRLGGLGIQVGAFIFTTRRVLKRSLIEMTLQLHRGWLSDLLFGALLATVAMRVLFAVYTSNGWLIVEGWHWQTLSTGEWLGILWGSILSCAQAAIGEEIIFRGYLLTGLKEAWGDRIGMLIMGVIFASLHLVVSSAAETSTLLFILALALPGLLLGWAYLRTGSLWLPIGIHFTWNLVQGELLNLPGNTSNPNIWGAQTRLTGPAWLVGTEYGVEVGLLGCVPLVIVFIGVWLWTLHKLQK